MAEQKTQQGSGQADIIEKKKEGFVKSPREYKYQKFGPDSPLPDRIRVFEFIEYRIQDNKRESESEVMSRDFIIKNTGICPNHFARIIKSLEKDNLITVQRGNYRDSCATYQLSKIMFPGSVICPDLKKEKPASAVDKSSADVDKSEDEKEPNTKMVSGNESKHQNGVDQNQSGVETDVSILESLTDSASRSLVSRTLEINPRALEGENPKESFTLLGSQSERPKPKDRALQLRWLKQTDGKVSFEEWEKNVC